MGLLRFFLGFPEVFKVVTFRCLALESFVGIKKKHEDIHFDPAVMVKIPYLLPANFLAHGFFLNQTAVRSQLCKCFQGQLILR